jgi:hypothetical protein
VRRLARQNGGVRRSAAASWALAVLAAVALTLAVLLLYADRTVFRTDGFTDRVDASLQSDAVSADVARRLSDAAIGARPDLVAVRPLVQSLATSVVRTEAFRSIVRGAARDVHRSVFDRRAGTVTLTVGDAGTLLATALGHARPDLAQRVPANLPVRFTAVSGGVGSTAVRAVALGERVRDAAAIALLAAALLGLGALLVSPSRRAAALRLGLAVATTGALVLAAVALAPRAVETSAAGRAVLETWLEPLIAWAAALAGAGLVVALAAASAARPVAVLPLVRRTAAAVARTPRGPRLRAARAVAAIALGVVLIVWPLAALEVAVASAGVLLALAGVSELLRLTADPDAPPVRGRGVPRGARIAAVAAALTAVLTGAAALAAGGGLVKAPRVGRCNGHAALCDRPLDQVAFAGTHNSMAADGEPGWLFAAQDAGIDAQLRDGIRALLIDTHYGFATPRGVATDLSGDTISRDKLESGVGEEFVKTAERLRTRIGYGGGGKREIFLCHAFCEVGATRAVTALAGVHRFLVAHPEEVLILSIEDDTSAADTAAAIRESGLIREVYLGPAKPPWPTLRELIDRDERVLVLVENHPGEPWTHLQSAVAQETPFHFSTPPQLAVPASCDANRGGTAGSLLLVNHWVDTSPAPRVSIAAEVNAPAFLDTRLDRCRTQRRLLPTVVAVDFYREGGTFAAVDRLNGVTPAG